MWESKFILQIWLIVTAASMVVQSRKYNIDDEAVKLYGEDLKAVVKRFRRTPDYLSIMMDKKNELMSRFNDVYLISFGHFVDLLKSDITKMYAKNTSEATTLSDPVLTYVRDDSVGLLSIQYRARKNDEDHSQNGVEYLESYPGLTSHLTLSERNMLRDMGYTTFGKLIHSVIRSMGSDDINYKSTRQPYDSFDNQHKYIITTDHAHDITYYTDQPNGQETIQDETYYKHRASTFSRQYA